MRRTIAVLTLAAVAALSLAGPAGAATAWTARMTGHGTATLYPATYAKLVVNLTGYTRGSVWTVTLRRGSCATAGTLIASTRITASSTGRLSKTLYLTYAQSRLAAALPLAIRAGSRCAPLTAPAPVAGVFGDGTWRVGPVPVLPGTYRTANGSVCVWERLSGFGGTLDEIIAIGGGLGPAVVSIAPTDAGFYSLYCGTWRLDAPAAPTSAPGDGTWRVGTDVTAGTYQASGGQYCYWARLSGFAGTLDDIVANGAATIVTIDPSDAGFQSAGCGTWTKTG